jgi:hypothetical protein
VAGVLENLLKIPESEFSTGNTMQICRIQTQLIIEKDEYPIEN